MTSQSVNSSGTKVSTVVSTIAAVIAIIAFIFGVTNWADIQQFFWRQRIVGTWQDELGTSITFSNEGTFTSGGLLPANGYYTFTDDNHIVLQVTGLLGIVGDQNYEVTFSGNRMIWKDTYLGNNISFVKY